MSFLSKAIVFCIRELVRPALEETGKHLGDALGTVLGRKIDPEHGKSKDGDKASDAEVGSDIYGVK